MKKKYSLLPIKLFLLLSAFILTSCGLTRSSKEISYQVLTESSYQGKKQESFEVIDNHDDLNKLYALINDELVPNVDFAQSRIVALFMGEKNTGGYAIGIEEIKTEGNKVIIKVKKSYPDGIASMAFSQPYMIARVDTTKKIEFVE